MRSKLQGWRETLHTPIVLDLAFEAAAGGAGGGAYRVRFFISGALTTHASRLTHHTKQNTRRS